MRRSLGALAENVKTIRRARSRAARARAPRDRTYVICIDTDPTRTTDGRRLVVGRGGARGVGARARCRPRATQYEAGKQRSSGRNDDDRSPKTVDAHTRRRGSAMTNGSTYASASTRSPGATTTCRRSAARRRSRRRCPKARRIGYEGFELGNKFPREPQALREVLGRARPRAASPAGTPAGSRAARSTRRSTRSAAHLELLADNGANVMVYGEVADSDPGRAACRCTSGRASSSRRSSGRAYGEQAHGVRAAHAVARRAPRLPPSHGRLRRDARRRRPADGAHRRRGRPAVRQRPHARSPAATRSRCCRSTSRACATCTARTCGRDVIRHGAQPQLELPRVGDQRRVHGARRRRRRFRARCSNVLRDAGYRGWLVVEAEQDPAVAPSYRYAEMGFRHLAELRAQAESGALEDCNSA